MSSSPDLQIETERMYLYGTAGNTTLLTKEKSLLSSFVLSPAHVFI
jgi:hypothetical protein